MKTWFVRDIEQLNDKAIQKSINLRVIVSNLTIFLSAIFMLTGFISVLCEPVIIAVFTFPAMAGLGIILLLLSIISDLQYQNLKSELRLRKLEGRTN